jgi:cytochrome c oxidase cbb3-type subunit I/II
MRTLGVPYEKGYENEANKDLMIQADAIAASLASDSIRISPNKEVIALISYVQHLGRDISTSQTAKKP